MRFATQSSYPGTWGADYAKVKFGVSGPIALGMTLRRQTYARAAALAAAAAAAAVAMPAAANAGPSLSGKIVRGKGYTVTVLAEGGAGVSRTVGANGSFSLPLPKSARGATVQLVTPDGRYYGPLVLASKRGKAFTALSGKPVKLGAIKLRGGWAAPVRAVAPKAFNARQAIVADRTGKPAGAGKLGLVASSAKLKKAAEGGGPGQGEGNGQGQNQGNGQGQGGQGQGGPGAGADPDRDGIPSAVDADDNGNLVLDTADPASAGGAGLFTSLYTPLARTLNANAAAVDGAAIDAGLVNGLAVAFYFDEHPLGGRTASAADVDCRTIGYCRTGKFSSMADSGVDMRDVPWASYDPNSNGLPNLVPQRSHDGRSVYAGSLSPGVGTGQIRPGDTYDVRFATDAGVVSVPTALSFMFVTTPAVNSYDDGTGPREVTYPASQDSAGSESNPARLASERVTLSLWRPQRAPIGTESGYIDMGGLSYGVTIDEPMRQVGCAGDYSALSPTLEQEAAAGNDPSKQNWPLRDSAADAPANPANRLTFTLDIGSCLRRNGIDPASRDSVELKLTAAGESRPGGNDRAVQTFRVALPR